MNLMVWALQAAIAEVARSKQLAEYRVDYKVNSRGEIVIALILPPTDDTRRPELAGVRAKSLR